MKINTDRPSERRRCSAKEMHKAVDRMASAATADP